MEHSMAPMWASTKAVHLEPTLVDTWALRMAALMVDHSADLNAGHSADSKVSEMVCLPVAAMENKTGMKKDIKKEALKEPTTET